MTTDLTGDFELGEDEFDWDVFLPDPDETDARGGSRGTRGRGRAETWTTPTSTGMARSATTPNPRVATASSARAGAAYDRIVDTVRRSFEDESSTGAEGEPEADTIGAFDPDDVPETPRDAAPDPVVTGVAGSFEDAVASEADVHRVVEWAPDAMPEPDDEPARAADPQPGAAWTAEPLLEPSAFVAEPDRAPAAAVGSEPDHETEVDDVGEPDDGPELDQWLSPDDDPLAGAFPEPAVAFEPAPTPRPVAPQFADAATTGAMIGAVQAEGLPSADDDTTRAMAPGGPEGVDDLAASTSDTLAAPSGEDHQEKPKRSLVFKATVVLACLFLLVFAAVVGLRALHHQTTAAPPSHATTPTQATGTNASGAGSAEAAASGTARIQAATDAVDSATTAASVGLTSLSAFPTPTNVETVINPYISSLQLFQAFLSGTKVPASAQSAATSAEAKIRQDLQFLETIDGLPPEQLGAFLAQFDTDATQLQTTLSTLEQDLRIPAS